MAISNYDNRYPSIADLKAKAKRRIPNFAFEYVDAAIDEEIGKRRNREAFNEIKLTPRYLTDVSSTDITVQVFDKRYDLPLGVPPIGLGNMMWPGAEMALARAAQRSNIPYILSTFSTTLLEDIANAAPEVCWFQLYVPKKLDVTKELIARTKQAGFKVLVVTLDIPIGAKRNREIKNDLKLPFSFTPRIVWQSAMRPVWAFEQLRHGTPDFVNILPYRESSDVGLAEFISDFTMSGVTLDRIEQIRKLWDGPLVLKGIQYEQNAIDAMNAGVDGIIVSNHGGRQLDAAPSSIESLKGLPSEVKKKITIMVDGGIRTGLDVVRAGALGAEFTFSGRSFFYGMAALGPKGATQVIEIFRDEITRTLKQLGCNSFTQVDQTWLCDSRPQPF